MPRLKVINHYDSLTVAQGVRLFNLLKASGYCTYHQV